MDTLSENKIETTPALSNKAMILTKEEMDQAQEEIGQVSDDLTKHINERLKYLRDKYPFIHQWIWLESEMKEVYPNSQDSLDYRVVTFTVRDGSRPTNTLQD